MKNSQWKELVAGIIGLIIFMSGFIIGVSMFLKHIIY